MEWRDEIQGFGFSADVCGNDGNGGCNSVQLPSWGNLPFHLLDKRHPVKHALNR